jgi:hypothetical protein
MYVACEKIGIPNNLKIFGSKQTKDPQQDSRLLLLLLLLLLGNPEHIHNIN